jgi:serine/threonine protein kinase
LSIVSGQLRAVKIVERRQFDSDRPYEREFNGIQRYEPVSRLTDGLAHVLHVGRNDEEGYFYYVMELADDSSVQSSTFNVQGSGAEASRVSSSPQATLNFEPGILNSGTYVPRTLRSDLKRLHRLPIADCLRLALDGVGGLAKLHEHGLVHRDVKPGNIIYVNGRAPLAISSDSRQLAVSVEGRRVQLWDLDAFRSELAKLELDW